MRQSQFSNFLAHKHKPRYNTIPIMFDEPVVYVDIETTGGSYRSSRIIEFAAIRVEGGKITETYQTLINPGTPIPYHITRLTGITANDVADQPFFVEIANDIHRILQGAIFIAHNVRFDYSFIKRQLEICNISFNPRMLCSVRISRALYPNADNHKLATIIKQHNIATAARHRAYDDAEAVRKFLEIAYHEHGGDVFTAAIKRQLKHRSAPPNVASDAFDAIPNTAGVYTFSDANGTPIYIGKSVTLRRRIMSHFTQDTAIDKEMKLSLNTHTISYIETLSELEALLLESQMIKQYLPVYNRQLRQYKQMYVLHAYTNEDGYRQTKLDFVNSDEITPDSSIYGVYGSKAKASRALEQLQITFDLCPKLLGLEKTRGACFKAQLRKCQGACIGDEPSYAYNERFESAFERSRIDSWPYQHPIVIQHSGIHAKSLVVDNWNVIGEIQATDDGCDPQYKPWQTLFDFDTYKILRSYIRNKSANIKLQPITYSELEQYC